MSTIHEALKRAQKERDTLSLTYGGIVAARGKKRGILGRGGLWGALCLILLILLAFVSYLWFDFTPVKGPSTGETRGQETSSSLGPETIREAERAYEKAGDFHRKGMLGEAKRCYLETLATDPGHVGALNNLGVIYLHNKDYPAARANFEKAIQLGPDRVDPYYNLACLYAMKGETGQGLAHLKKAVSMNPKVREWARKDRDLENLRRLVAFEEIISQAAPLTEGAGEGLERANQAH